MKKLNKKGFTIVELVIVIAVIAILAGVLIPTFSNVIDNAHKSADQSAAKSKLDELIADDTVDGKVDGKINDTDITKPDGVTTYATDGKQVTEFVYKGEYYTYTYKNEAWAAAENAKDKS